jgi:hypothetical protein
MKEKEPMKMLRASALVGLLACAAAFGQPQPQGGILRVDAPNPQYELRVLTGNPYELQAESAQLAKRYVDSKKEGEKDEIRKKLEDAVNKQFDQHMEQQQKELQELEKQIEHLRSVLQKRQDQKSSIVRRRIDQLIHEAEGLGWNAPGGGNDFWVPRPLLNYQPAPLTDTAKKAPQSR